VSAQGQDGDLRETVEGGVGEQGTGGVWKGRRGSNRGQGGCEEGRIGGQQRPVASARGDGVAAPVGWRSRKTGRERTGAPTIQTITERSRPIARGQGVIQWSASSLRFFRCFTARVRPRSTRHGKGTAQTVRL